MEKEEKIMENKKSPHLFKKIITFLFFILIFGVVKSADAAFLYFSPAQGSFYQNENFTVSVFVNAEVAINAAEGLVIFPTELLEVISLDYAPKSGSVVNLWVQNPSFSNAGDLGNVSFGGVILNPGFTGPAGKMLEVVFRVKKEGSADLAFTNFAILANDGFGTNVSAPNGRAYFVFLPARVVLQETPLQPLQSGISQNKDDIKEVKEKVASLESEIKEKVLQLGSGEAIIIGFWNILPQWLKFGILGLVGLATLLLGLIVFSFGIIVLIWIWSRAWRKRKKIARGLISLPGQIERFFRRIFITLGWATEEVSGDVKYSFKLAKRGLRIAARNKSLTQVLKNYLTSILKIFKRFRKRNVPQPEE